MTARAGGLCGLVLGCGRAWLDAAPSWGSATCLCRASSPADTTAAASSSARAALNSAASAGLASIGAAACGAVPGTCATRLSMRVCKASSACICCCVDWWMSMCMSRTSCALPASSAASRESAASRAAAAAVLALRAVRTRSLASSILIRSISRAAFFGADVSFKSLRRTMRSCSMSDSFALFMSSSF